MASKYNLKITPACAGDLDNIFRYISETVMEPVVADKLMDDIENAFKNACEYPLMYPLSEDDNLNRRGYHKLVVKNYIALYLVDEPRKSVIFARVFYGRQEYMKLL